LRSNGTHPGISRKKREKTKGTREKTRTPILAADKCPDARKRKGGKDSLTTTTDEKGDHASLFSRKVGSAKGMRKRTRLFRHGGRLRKKGPGCVLRRKTDSHAARRKGKKATHRKKRTARLIWGKENEGISGAAEGERGRGKRG